MKNHPPILVIVPVLAIACYLVWSLLTGSLQIRGVAQPLKRQEIPREYWRYMWFFLAVFGIMLVIFGWVFL